MTRHKFNRGNDGQRLYHMHGDRASCQLERQRRVQLRLCPLLLLSPPIASLRSPHERRSFGRNTVLTIDFHIISPSPNRRRHAYLLCFVEARGTLRRSHNFYAILRHHFRIHGAPLPVAVQDRGDSSLSRAGTGSYSCRYGQGLGLLYTHWH